MAQIEFLDRVTQADLTTVAEFLEPLNLNNFRYAANGDTAVCFESGGRIVRVGSTPWTPAKPTGIQMDFVRHRCPLIVQADHVMTWEKKAVFEILPFMALLPDNRIPEMYYTEIVGRVIQGTCFKTMSVSKDLAVLPDGTPIYVDPGAINLKSWDRQPTSRDFEIIRDNTKRLNLPEPLSWVLPGGRFKQDLFFPKPVNAVDLVV